jgi:hypothetical protein
LARKIRLDQNIPYLERRVLVEINPTQVGEIGQKAIKPPI